MYCLNLTRFKVSLFLKKLFKVFAFNLFHIEREIIYELDLTKDIRPVQATIPLKLRWGTEEDILAMDKDHEYDEKAKRYTIKRLKIGDKLLFLTHGEKIVGYHLMMKGAMELSSSQILKLSPKKIYLYKGFVVKFHRGMKIIDHLIYETAIHLKSHSFEKLIMTVSEKNHPMLRVMKKLAWKPVGRIVLFRALGFEIPYVPRKTLKLLKQDG